MRRRLQFSPQEWDALPGHHQRMYIEGLIEEFVPKEQKGGGSGPRDAHNLPATEFLGAGATVRRVAQPPPS